MSAAELIAIPGGRAWPRGFALAAIGIALVAGIGWLLDIELLRSVLHAWSQMRPATAVSILFIGGALLLLSRDTTRLRRTAGRTLALLAPVLPLLGLLDPYVDYGHIGTVLAWNHGSPDTWMMAQVTAVAFLLLCGALLSLGWGRRRLSAQYAALAVLVLMLTALAAYAFGAEYLYGFRNANQIALNTAVAILLLALSVLFSTPEVGLMRTLLARNDGGAMARFLLPPAIIAPLLLGALRLAGEEMGWYGVHTGVALSAVGAVALMVVLICVAAVRISRADDQRMAAQQELFRYKESLEAEVRGRTAELTRMAAHLRATLETTDDGIVVIGPDERVVVNNQNHLDMWGLTQQQVDTLSVNEIYEAFKDKLADPDGFWSATRSRYSDYAVSYTDEVRFKDGRVLERMSRPIYIEGEYFGRLTSFRDITARVRATEALAQSEAQYRTLFESASDAILLTEGPAAVLLEANAQFFELYGLSRDEVVGRPLVGLVIDAEAGQQAVDFLMGGGELRNAELTLRRSDGAPVTILASAKLIEYEGRPVILSIHRDVTELRRREAALAETQRRFEGIVASAMDAIITVDESQRILVFNTAAERIFGYSAEEAIGQRIEMLIPPDYRQGHAASVLRYGRTGVSTRHMRGLGELTARRKSGEEFPFEGTISQVEVAGQKYFSVILRDVTERKRAENVLGALSALQQTTLNSTADGIIVVDERGSILLHNQRFRELWGIPEDVMKGATRETTTPYVQALVADFEGFVAETNRLYGQPDYAGFTTIRLKDGRVLERYSQPHRVGGRPAGRVSSFRDVTERVRSAEALARQAALQESVLESTLDGILVVDADDRVILFNRALLRLWNVTADQLQGRSFTEVRELVADQLEDPQRFKEECEALYADAELRQHVTLRLQDGRVIERLSLPHKQDGRTVGRVSSFRDVTQRERSAAEVARSLALLQATLESVEEGVVVVGADDSVLASNQRYLEQWGLAATAADQPNEDSVPAALAQLKEPEEVYRSYREITADPQRISKDVIEFADGRTLERYSRPQVVDGRTVGRVWSFLDVTARRAAEENRARLEQQLRQSQKMEAIGTLAGGIAHDFNNILYAIQGFAELVLEDLPEGGQAHLNQQEVLRSAARAAELVSQILAFSRKTPVERGPVDLRLVAEEAGKLMRATLPATVDIRLDLAPDRAVVIASAISLHQILMNLCSNAGHAMPRGGRLSLALREYELEEHALHQAAGLTPGRYFLLSVSDTGSGIAPENLERIFEPFFTTKEVGSGTGLGLSTVYGIVKELGGLITVYSELGVGTTFNVYLPVAEGTAASAEAGGGAAAIRPGHERVLFVDDEQSLVAMGKQVLQQLGYHVTAFADPAEALAAFEAAPGDFDIVVSDETMPGLRGSELAARVARLRPELPVIICTGFNQQLFDAPLHPSIRAVLQKPVSRVQLSSALRAALDAPARS